MNIKNVLTSLFIVLGCFFASGQAFDAALRTTNAVASDLMLVQTNSAGSAGQRFTRSITLSNLLNVFTNFNNWPTTGGSATNAISTFKTNGVNVTTAATSLDFITGSNTLVKATNTAGAVTIQINANASASGATNIYTNAVYINATSANAFTNGVSLTNAILAAPYGSVVIVGPGSYSLGTNDTPSPLIANGVDLYFEPGSIVSSYGSVMFDDGGGPITNRVFGYGTFLMTNTAANTIVAISEATSHFYFENNRLSVYSQNGACISHVGGTLLVKTRELASSDNYDAAIIGDTLVQRFEWDVARVEAGGDIIECNTTGYPIGGCHIRIGYGRGGTFGLLKLARNVRIDFDVIEAGNSDISMVTALGNIVAPHYPVMSGGYLFSTNTATNAIIGQVSNGSSSIHFKNCVIQGSDTYDLIRITNSTPTSPLILENCTILPGANSTNVASIMTAPGSIEIRGTLHLMPHKPFTGMSMLGTNRFVNSRGSTLFVDTALDSPLDVFGGTVTATNLVVAGGLLLFEGTVVAESTNLISSLTEDTSPAFNDFLMSEDVSSQNIKKVQLAYVTNFVRLAGGAGGITVSQADSGNGIRTWTINDDDAGGGSATNFIVTTHNTLFAGDATVTNDLRILGQIVGDPSDSDYIRIGNSIAPATDVAFENGIWGVSVWQNVASQSFLGTNLLIYGTDVYFPSFTTGRVAAFNRLNNLTNSQVTIDENGNMASPTNIAASTMRATNTITLLGITASRPAYINSSGQITNASGTPDGTKFMRDDGVLATPSGGGGGTNFPPVITLLGATNITLGSGVRQHLTIFTNGDFGLSFNGAALRGETVRVGVSNLAATNITVSIYDDSTASTYFDPYVASNVSAFVVRPLSISTLEWLWHTNFNDTTIRQELQWSSELQFAMNVGSNHLAAITNGGLITVQVTNFTGTGAIALSNAPIVYGATLLGTTAAGRVDVRTNANVSQVNTTNGIAYVSSTISGVGGANTNFTGQATDAVVYIDGGTTNVNFVAIMPGTAGLTYFPTYVISNLTTTARQIYIGESTTNFWRNLQQYDSITSPVTLTNKHTGILSVMINGTNTWWAWKQSTNGF